MTELVLNQNLLPLCPQLLIFSALLLIISREEYTCEVILPFVYYFVKVLMVMEVLKPTQAQEHGFVFFTNFENRSI